MGSEISEQGDVGINAGHGISVRLHSALRAANGRVTSYRLLLIADGLSAEVKVDNAPFGDEPTALFRSISGNWRGWEGELKWRAIEGEYVIVAVFNKNGSVSITFAVHPQAVAAPPAWTATVILNVESAELDALLGQFTRFFASTAHQ